MNRSTICSLAILASLILFTACKYATEVNGEGVIRSVTKGTLEIEMRDGFYVHVGGRNWGAVEKPEVGQCVIVSANIRKNKEDESNASYYLPLVNRYVMPCDFSHPQAYMMPARVISSWQDKETNFVEVVVGSFRTTSEIFSDRHFPGLKLNVDDCVKVWVRDYHTTNGFEELIIDNGRNLSLCEN